jgi:hypothetical protein
MVMAGEWQYAGQIDSLKNASKETGGRCGGCHGNFFAEWVALALPAELVE